MFRQVLWWKQVGGGSSSVGCERGQPCGKGAPNGTLGAERFPGSPWGWRGGPKLGTASHSSLRFFQTLGTSAGLRATLPRGDREWRWGCRSSWNWAP